jgi:hypothetical protein
MKKYILIILATILMVIFIILNIFGIINVSDLIKDILFLILSILNILALLNLILASSKIMRRHSVAFIGFPQSGKTILITALCNELIKKDLHNKYIPRGKTTERVYEDIRRLENGIKLKATTEQDLFAYRFDIKMEKQLFRKIKFEIGDCPGEDSKNFAEKYGEWLHKTPFFNWVMEADAFVFIVDLVKDFFDENYFADIKMAIRVAWQNILDYHKADKKGYLRKKQILLVFSKGDLLHYMRDINYTKEDIKNIGFGEKLPSTVKYNEIYIKTHKDNIQDKYNDVISYLSEQTIYFSFHFASYFAINEITEERMGLNDIIKYMLPK